MADAEGRTLCELRVFELRTELEKRNLDKSGVKVVLYDRLEKALKDEGHDPKSYQFESLSMEKKSPTKKNSHSGSNAEGDLEESLDDVNVDEMVVKDEVVDDEIETELDKENTENGEVTEPSSGAPTEVKEEPTEEKPEVCKKREGSQGPEEPAKKVRRVESPVQEAPEPEKGNSEINRMDAEDSINLDIGEDELLNEEGDGRMKATKDGAEGEREAASAGQGPQEAQQVPPGAPESANSVPDTHSASGTAEGDKTKDEKESKKSSSACSRNLWVSGLSGATRAKDLKILCSRHGKVVGAKVVTNARTPGSRCYGYVTMVSAADADACIKYLHRTELHGRLISVEKAKSELGASGWSGSTPWSGTFRGTQRPPRRQDKPKDGEEGDKSKEGPEKKEAEGREGKEGERRASKGDSQEPRRKMRGRSGRKDRSPHRKPLSPREVLSFSKIRKEREEQRERERLRRARSEDRRRRLAEQALRDQERRQRLEKQRLAEEREKLRLERERIDREKSELHRIERERQKLEREKLEYERLELKRAQLKLEEERRAKQRGYAYGGGSSPPWGKGGAYDSRGAPKRAGGGGGGFGAAFPEPAAPPQPPYERPSAAAPVDKRDRQERRDYRHAPAGKIGGSSSSMKYQTNGSSYESRQPLPPGTRPREQSRYESSASGRGGGGERGGYGGAGGAGAESRGAHSPKAASRDHRYPDSSATSKGDYDRSGNNWHAGSGSAAKGGFPSAPPSWNKPQGETWSNSASGERGGYGGGGYGGSSEVRYPLHQPAPPGSQLPASFPDTRYTWQRDYRK